jgi:D-serine deaminase-like pyridoxal phosphate-dependent protein
MRVDMIDEMYPAVETPALIVDWSRVRANVSRMASLARQRNITLRPHIKTHKLVALAQLQVDEGAVGITVAKLGEAEVMADHGLTDILVAYPIVGGTKISRLLDLAQRVRISVAVDSIEAGAALSRAATERAIRLPTLVEIDTGLRRCGVLPGEPAVGLARALSELAGLNLVGILTHEGHAYTAGVPGGLRTATLNAAEAMAATAEQFESAGLPVEIVSMGSSGTAFAGMGQPHVTEFRPGTYVYNDRTQVALGAAHNDDCAATVLVTVVGRTSAAEVLIDAGSKLLTSDRMIVAHPPPTYGEVVGHPDWQVVRQSEEHGILDGPGINELAIGDRLSIIPNHICPVVNLVDRVVVVDGAECNAMWVDARGKSQ